MRTDVYAGDAPTYAHAYRCVRIHAGKSRRTRMRIGAYTTENGAIILNSNSIIIAIVVVVVVLVIIVAVVVAVVVLTKVWLACNSYVNDARERKR